MDNITVEKYGGDSPYEVQVRTDIGGRLEQQDSAYLYTSPGMAFALVCDGMGGTDNGALAGRLAVDSMQMLLKKYLTQQPRCTPPEFLLDALVELDSLISCELGQWKGGTTAVAAFLVCDNFYWASAGDSRLYIFRGGELVQATRDHNYFLRLHEQLKSGEISQVQFDQEAERGEALISYLGVGGLSVYDLTNAPLKLRNGDILLLTTDGLYKAIPQKLIRHILCSGESLETMADKLIAQITVLKQSVVLDNTTFALIRVNTEGIANE